MLPRPPVLALHRSSPRRRAWGARAGLLLGAALWLAACAGEAEGDAAGECEDGADNDRDGMFDCNDPDCLGAPACADDSDAPASDDSDPPAQGDAVCAADGWAEGDAAPRPAGPHVSEVGKVSAWLIDVASAQRTVSAACGDSTSDEWAPVFELGAEAPDPTPGRYNYVFYEVQPGCDEAVKQACSAADCFPDCCQDDARTYARAAHTWTAPEEKVDAAVDPLLAPGCTIRVEQAPVVEDLGEAGRLTYVREIRSTANCPPLVLANDGCVIRFSYDLSWVKSE